MYLTFTGKQSQLVYDDHRWDRKEKERWLLRKQEGEVSVTHRDLAHPNKISNIHC